VVQLLTNLHSDSEKQINQGWGAPKGDAEWKDEQAGEAIAKAEEKVESGEGEGEGAVADAAKDEPTFAAEPEPEDNTKSYSEYLAELAEKKLQVGGAPPARKPNEGSKQDKKWAKAKELKKDEEEEAYITGAGGKAKRERQRKEKAILEIDQRYVEPSRGNREGGRGGRGRGEGRGDYRGGDRGRGGRGRGEGRGEFRGGRGGSRGGSGTQVNVADTDAFPSLGK
jgi:plasminogen activator inhibitor 1 RNA-binding protein